jgi:signal transduction histidine kinase
MRSRRPQPILLGDPGSAEHLAEVSGLVVLAAASVGILGLAGSALIALSPAHWRPAGYHPLGVAAFSAVALLSAALGRRRPQLFTPARLVYLLPVAVVSVAVTAYLAGPQFASLVTMFLTWFASSITYLPRRHSLALMAWVALVYAVLLVVQSGNFLPLARWEITIGMLLATAVFMNRMVERSWALARSEQAAREDAERARSELEVVSEQKSRFLARMSHELRTPLNAIIGFSQVLARRSYGELNPKQAEYVSDVVDSGQHLLALVDELLDLAKVETGTLELEAGRVDLAGLLGGSLALFEEQAGRQSISLALDVSPGLGVIEADPRKLKQVMFNLLANAVRFTPSGGRVVLGARRAGGRVRISVSDTGPGIAPEEREAIFEEFRQGSAGDDAGGTGLGLPLARRLVELHGGRLYVESESGRGSIFTVDLPVRPALVSAARRTSSPPGERPVRLLLGETDSPERRIETARLLAIGAIAMTGMAVVATVIFHAHPVAEMSGYGDTPLLIGTALALATSVGFLVRPQWTGSPRVLPYLCTLPILTVSVTLALTDLGQGMEGVAGLVYAWVAAAVFLILPPRQVMAELILIAVGLAVALTTQGGVVAPWTQWLVMMGFVVGTGLIFRRFVSRIQAMAMAERAARSQAERVSAELAVASRHKTEFLANMSHELRTPLNVIIGFSEVLESQAFGPLNTKQAEYVADVFASGRHLLGLINDILDLAKAEAGRAALHLADLELDTMLAAAVSPFRKDASRRRVDLSLEVRGLGRVEADEAKLVQALGHMIDNALKFTSEGGRVTVLAARDIDHVEISVSDTGRGIDAADHERIFDAFTHGEDTPGTETGSGLGLALARRYAELHGGGLSVRSDLGLGATFILRLPVRRSPVEPATPAEVA